MTAPVYRVAVFGKEFIKGQDEPVLFVELMFETTDPDEAIEFGIEHECAGKHVVIYDPAAY